MVNALFICGRNRKRSPTAEEVFAQYDGVETASAGISSDADVPVTPELLEWADLIFVMEKAQRAKLAKNFPRSLSGKRIICLDIRDKYAYGDPALIEILKSKVSQHLR